MTIRKKEKRLTQEQVRALFRYDPETGVLTFRPRGWEHFGYRWGRTNRWNATWAGKPAGVLSAHGYLTLRLFGRVYLLHRLIWLWMTGEWPEDEVDHKDHVRSNNRWANLRSVPAVENKKNKSVYSNNKSGVMGVSYDAKRSRWGAAIGVENSTVWLGTFEDRADAIAARRAAEVQYGFHPNHNVSA